MGIYAGRTERPWINKHFMNYEELADRVQEQEKSQGNKVQEVVKDKVTFSKEGMESARAMRDYLNENNLNSYGIHAIDVQEMEKEFRTTYLDCSNNFLTEMQEVINEERKAWGSEADGQSFDNSMALTTKAYQVVHDRIVDEFARKDRETTYIIDKESGERREETVDDRLAELEAAYDGYTTFVAASQKAMAQIKEKFGGVKIPEKPEDVEKKTKQAYMEAVSEKNLERARQKVNSHLGYRPELSLGIYWEQILAKIW